MIVVDTIFPVTVNIPTPRRALLQQFSYLQNMRKTVICPAVPRRGPEAMGAYT